MKKVVLIRSNPVNPDPPVEKIAETLLKSGYEITIVAWDRENGYDISEDKLILANGQSAKIVRFGIPAIYGGGLKRTLKALLTFQFKLKAWLKEHKDEYDIIHAFDLDTGFVAKSMAQKYNKKFFYHILDFYVDSHPSGGEIVRKIVKKAEFSVINYADATIICTEKRKEQIEGSKPKKLVVIHNTPKDSIDSLSQDICIEQNDKLKIAYVGTFTEGRLLEELCQLVEENINLELHIGGYGFLEDKIKQYAEKNDNIIFYGKLPYNKTLSLENQCDVMTAIYDPNVANHKYAAPNKFYEALMLGKPVIMAKNTGFDEIFKDNHIGSLIEYSKEGLNDGLKKIKSDVHKMNDSKNLYKDKYSWEIMEKRIVEMYERIVG